MDLDYVERLFAAQPGFTVLALCFYLAIPIMLFVPRLRAVISRPTATSHLAELDGLRGVLAFIVVGAHYTVTYGDNPIKHLMTFLPLAVPTFALLSGFVLYRSFRTIDAEVMRSFLIRRVFRIYPVYVLCFLMTMVGIAEVHSVKFIVVNLLPLLKDLFMLDLLQIGFRIGSPTWSLFPEMAYSFLLPIFLLVFGRRSLRLNIAVYLLLLVYGGSSGDYVGLFRYFWLGMIVLQLYEEDRLPLSRLRKPVIEIISLIVFVAGGIYIYGRYDFVGDIVTLLGAQKPYGWLGGTPHISQDIGILLVFLGVLKSRTLKVVLRSPPLQYLGLISYSIYLIHSPLAFINAPLSFDIDRPSYQTNLTYFDDGGAAFFLLYFPALLFVATLSFVLVERVGMKWGIRVSKKMARDTPIVNGVRI